MCVNIVYHQWKLMQLPIHYISPFMLYKQKVYQLNRQILNFILSAHFGVVGEPLCSSMVVFPLIPAHVSLWWIAAWTSGRLALGTKYWQVSRFPSPYSCWVLLSKVSELKTQIVAGKRRRKWFVIVSSLFGINFKRSYAVWDCKNP